MRVLNTLLFINLGLAIIAATPVEKPEEEDKIVAVKEDNEETAKIEPLPDVADESTTAEESERAKKSTNTLFCMEIVPGTNTVTVPVQPSVPTCPNHPQPPHPQPPPCFPPQPLHNFPPSFPLQPPQHMPPNRPPHPGFPLPPNFPLKPPQNYPPSYPPQPFPPPSRPPQPGYPFQPSPPSQPPYNFPPIQPRPPQPPNNPIQFDTPTPIAPPRPGRPQIPHVPQIVPITIGGGDPQVIYIPPSPSTIFIQNPCLKEASASDNYRGKSVVNVDSTSGTGNDQQHNSHQGLQPKQSSYISNSFSKITPTHSVAATSSLATSGASSFSGAQETSFKQFGNNFNPNGIQIHQSSLPSGASLFSEAQETPFKQFGNNFNPNGIQLHQNSRPFGTSSTFATASATSGVSKDFGSVSPYHPLFGSRMSSESEPQTKLIFYTPHSVEYQPAAGVNPQSGRSKYSLLRAMSQNQRQDSHPSFQGYPEQKMAFQPQMMYNNAEHSAPKMQGYQEPMFVQQQTPYIDSERSVYSSHGFQGPDSYLEQTVYNRPEDRGYPLPNSFEQPYINHERSLFQDQDLQGPIFFEQSYDIPERSSYQDQAFQGPNSFQKSYTNPERFAYPNQDFQNAAFSQQEPSYVIPERSADSNQGFQAPTSSQTPQHYDTSDRSSNQPQGIQDPQPFHNPDQSPQVASPPQHLASGSQTNEGSGSQMPGMMKEVGKQQQPVDQHSQVNAGSVPPMNQMTGMKKEAGQPPQPFNHHSFEPQIQNNEIADKVRMNQGKFNAEMDKKPPSQPFMISGPRESNFTASADQKRQRYRKRHAELPSLPEERLKSNAKEP